MHFMPDTEDEDSAAETFWPEGYKQIIREDFRWWVGIQLTDEEVWKNIYWRRYTKRFTNPDQFVSRMADMIAIGAENGADDAFDDIISAFLTESPLPEVRKYARYLWCQFLPKAVGEKLQQVIVDEYSQDNIYNHAYRVGYEGRYRSFKEFIDQVAQIVVTGAANGADDMVEGIYRSFVFPYPLPPARRHPRRLKSW